MPAGCAGGLQRRPAGARIDAGRQAWVAAQQLADTVDVAEDDRGREVVGREFRRLREQAKGATRAAADARLAECVGLLGEVERAGLDRFLQPRPAWEAVLASDRELRDRKSRRTLRDVLEAAGRVRVSALGGAEQLLRLVAELVEVRVRREC